ncbi:MAG: 4Fe-4S binding protein [Nitrososphaerota archaeon]|nr:4Fe-4S binding protein [Nitrososphaerota archaeon]
MKAKIWKQLLKFNTPRRIVQLLSFLFLSATILNVGYWPILLPVLWTWGLERKTAGDAFTALQLMLSGWSGAVVFPWLAVASFLVVGVLIGKSPCGWVCPFGFIQDLLNFVKVRKKEVSPKTHESLTYMKYLVLGVVLLISVTFSVSKVLGTHKSYESAFGIFAYAPFTSLSPAETLFAIIPKAAQGFIATVMEKSASEALLGILTLPVLFWVQIFILALVIVLAVYIPRGWCRYLCPHGAIMAILNKFSFLGLRRDPVKCVKGECRACVKACPMQVRILDLPWEKFSHQECIYCLKCVDACPNKAIRLAYP